MIAASPEISRYGIVFAAAHVFNSLDDHHETKSSRQFLPTENPEGPLEKGDDSRFSPLSKGSKRGFVEYFGSIEISVTYPGYKRVGSGEIQNVAMVDFYAPFRLHLLGT